MQIRKATSGDIENIKKINSLIFSRNQEYDKDSIKDFAQTSEGHKYFDESIKSDTGIFILAEESNELIGYINGDKIDFPYRKGKYFEIHNLGVLTDSKRKGVGTILVKEMLEILKNIGYTKIYLNCYAKNTEALEFYRHLGFEDIDVCLEKEIL